MSRPFDDVPLDYLGNLEYRYALYDEARRSRSLRKYIWEACEKDVMFWMSAFATLYEPRHREGREKIIPFTPWEHQTPVIESIYESLGKEDIGITKSRGEGMSWIAVLLALHTWLFKPGSSVGMVSRTESDADNPRNPDSLFWKVDKNLEWMPPWMSGYRGRHWERSIKDHVLFNKRNGSTIRAYACTGDVASGGRMSWMLMDELAKFKRGADQDAMNSTQHVTESRLIVSTPKGAHGAYYDLMHGNFHMKKIVLDWKDNPYRNRGLYRLERGNKVTPCDPENNPLLPDYGPPNDRIIDMWNRLRLKGFVLEDTVRSAWYDRECDRPAATPQSIAQELDRSYGGSVFRVFKDDVFKKVEETVRPPFRRGGIIVGGDEQRVNWQDENEGPVLLWCSLDATDRPPPGRYVVSCDISSGIAGDYTSNSVLQVIDQMRQEQVLEYATNCVIPTDFADLAVAVSKWFHDAFLIWEANGPGTAFTAQMRKNYYPRVYERSILWKRGVHKKTKDIGFWTDVKNKPVLFDEATIMLRSGSWTVHSKDLVTEMGQYIQHQGSIQYVNNVNNDLNNAASHGDRVMAFLIGLHACRSRPIDRPEKANKEFDLDNAPSNTMAARVRAFEEEERKSKDRDIWDEVESADLTNSRRQVAKNREKEAAHYLG